MFWIILLQFINSFEGLSGAKHEILCTSSACITLHMDRLTFEEAHKKCVDNGGSLMTVREREEEEPLRLLLLKIHRHHQDRAVQFWIGLKLPTANCVSAKKALRGFKWVSGNEDSQYSNWEKEPDETCTTERCVSVNYTLSGQNQLKWIAGSCKKPSFYACKFNFKETCKPLVLMGPGEINYTLPFSKEPERSELKSFPLGTYAIISCNDKQGHYTVCKKMDEWDDPGPFCRPDKQNCMINRCQHECHQDSDKIRCVCKEGYDLDEDGFSCRIKNLCQVDTCEHLCVMSESGYFCKCPHGFRLEVNQRNCSDVDECQSQACEDHVCVNMHGSYRCVCRDGYEMADGKCSDINECAQSRCQHSCSNSVGSFSCYCDKGFALSEDGHSCVDINECVDSLCEFACVNTVGGFNCTCPQGSYLEPDGLKCAPYLTETSTASSDEAPDEEENFTEALIKTTAELQHQSPHTDAPLPDLVNVTHGDQQSNTSLTTSIANTVSSRLIICVLGSVIPLLLLIVVTLAIAVFRCSRSKKKAKKNTTTDGYCWVSSGLDPRLEKLYESILTDDV